MIMPDEENTVVITSSAEGQVYEGYWRDCPYHNDEWQYDVDTDAWYIYCVGDTIKMDTVPAPPPPKENIWEEWQREHPEPDYSF